MAKFIIFLLFISFSSLVYSQTFDGVLTPSVLSGWGFATTATSINIAQRSIVFIQPNTFQSYVNLKELYINSNKITNITTSTFTGLNKLEILYLYSNEIEILEVTSFRGLDNLKTFYLYSNNKKHFYFKTHKYSKLKS